MDKKTFENIFVVYTYYLFEDLDRGISTRFYFIASKKWEQCITKKVRA